MPRQHCWNLADIAREKSRANIEQKDKIVWNSNTNYVLQAFGLYVIIIVCLHYKTFVRNIKLPSLRHKRPSGYTEHRTQL